MSLRCVSAAGGEAGFEENPHHHERDGDDQGCAAIRQQEADRGDERAHHRDEEDGDGREASDEERPRDDAQAEEQHVHAEDEGQSRLVATERPGEELAVRPHVSGQDECDLRRHPRAEDRVHRDPGGQERQKPWLHQNAQAVAQRRARGGVSDAVASRRNTSTRRDATT